MKLLINGKQADYKGNIAITLQSFDANDPGSSRLDITNRIELLDTDNNKKIFSNPRNLDSDAIDINYDAKVIDSYFLFNGTGQLIEVGKDKKIQLAETSKVFFNELNSLLSELDFENDDIVYNSTSYEALKNLSNSPWVWSIVQMHESISETSLQYLRPHFSYWSILNKIFESKGWEFTIDTDLVQNIGLQANSKDFYFTSYQKTLTGTTIGALTDNDFSHNVTLTSNSIDVGTNKTAFRLRGDILSIGESILTIGDEQIIINNGLNSYDEITGELTGNVNISLTGNVLFQDTLLYTTIKESSFDDLATFNPIGYLVKVYDNLPELNQIDIFKDALKFTNSIFKTDSLNNCIEIKSLSKLSSQNKVDWSNKFIEDSEIIRNKLDNINRKNLLQYNNSIGDSFFNTEIAALTEEKEYLKFRYSGSLDKVNYSIYNVYEVDSDGNNKRVSGDQLRVIFIDGIYGKFTPLNWVNLSLNYYKGYFDSLNKPREITAQFNLKKLDVIGFDNMVLVYIEKFNSNFIVQRINEYIPNKETTVKLLRYGR